MALLQAKTENGLVEGLPAGNQMVSLFKGIPFAKAPVGDLRFRAPEPAEPWEGIYPAYRFAPIAMQPRFASEGGNTLAAREFYVVEFPRSEDCLYLNIWTPAKSAEENLPVAVYFHGGGFETGYSYLNAYDGEGFAKRGIVFVSIAYRLNVFGFLALDELAQEDAHGSTGNYGTMDQVAGLEWVKRNIAAFGGDPEQITIFGQSAGGFSVMNLCASPLTDGLFQRAIMQSGGGLARKGALNPTMQEAKRRGQEFLKFVGANNVAEARKLPADFLVEKYQEFKSYIGIGIPFAPAVDGYVNPMLPEEYFLQGKHTVKDTMIGSTADEMRHKDAALPSSDTLLQMAKSYGSRADEFLTAIQSESPEKCRKHFEDPVGDGMLAASIAWCENQNKLGRKPAFMYYFTYVPPGAEETGAHHSVEHHYVFQTLVRSLRPYTGHDYDLSNQLADYWANFIKTGDPNGAGKKSWEPYIKETQKTLIIGEACEMKKMEPNTKVGFLVDYNLKG
ncbi:carboxylesterase/lipase family protein [Hominifimenecus sp. rT4P-3]|uniref:carboxylesterase/lipase family protein n=1 Tax=Hominifimenecus sp. rT4P-3 TaxID=3242979 RepID=UPI003DA6AF22